MNAGGSLVSSESEVPVPIKKSDATFPGLKVCGLGPHDDLCLELHTAWTGVRPCIGLLECDFLSKHAFMMS